MAALRKSLLGLAVVLLALAGTSGTAFAQHPFAGLVTCVANAAPSLVRAEGLAELEGDIVLVCTTTASIGLPATLPTNFNVSLNVNMTNNRGFDSVGSNITDAVLIVNENTTVLPAVGQGDGGASLASGNGQTPQLGRQTGNVGIAWNGVLVPVPDVGGNPEVTTIRITNIRANAFQLGLSCAGGGASFPSAQVTAFVSATGTTNLTVTNNVLNIGTPACGLATPKYTSLVNLQECVSLNLNSSGNIIHLNSTTGPAPHDLTNAGLSATADGTFSIRVSEGFATAFKTLGPSTLFPGLTQVENGYCNAADGNGTGCFGAPGGATQGTRLIVRFYNVPTGVRIATPTTVRGTNSIFGGSPHQLTLLKVPGTDANGNGGALGSAVIEVTITNGFGFAVYEVTDDNPFAVEFAYIPVEVAWTSNTGATPPTPATGTMQASVALAPLSTVSTSDTAAPRPRFIDDAAPTSVVAVNPCLTNLLFPFVTNVAGFDTGMEISNTTADDKGTTAQAGTCTLFYYGTTSPGAVAVNGVQQTTSSAVTAGSTITLTLSGGNSAIGITGMLGFQGYIFARCNFQFAHGFAFITDGFGGVPNLAEGYLALVIPWDGASGDRTTVLGESVGH
jgi:hypothetical protein